MSQPSPTPTLQNLTLPPLHVLSDAAREAGEIALRYFGKAKSWTKAGDSPVTEADLAIDHMLHGHLRGAYPGFGWLSEEIEDDGSRLSGAPTFIVDPIDGTRGFMDEREDWAVSIALIQNGEPKLGVLFQPVTGQLYFAEAKRGAHLEASDGTVTSLTPQNTETLHNALLAAPGPRKDDAPFRRAAHIASLALRIARVANGALDGCIAKPHAKHWDIAAADLLVREVGLRLEHASSSSKGHRPRYDTASIAHPALVCGTSSLCDTMQTMVSTNHS
ncbi:MAG: 3'(2'),5'-bisphosphate nucleotidase CysQ [Pseudomonadota bacterium]